MKEIGVKELLNKHRACASLFGDFHPDKTLKHLLKRLNKQKKELSLKVSRGESPEKDERWVFDNAALLSGILVDCLGVRVPRSTHVLFYVLMEEYDAPLREEDLDVLFSFLAREGFSHRAFSTFREALIISAAKLLLFRLQHGGDVSAPIVTLRTFSRMDISPLVLAYSPLDRLLCSEHTKTYSKLEYEFRARLWKQLESLAKKEKLSLEECAKKVLSRAEESGVYFGELLPKKRVPLGLFYTLLTCGTSLLLGVLFSLRLTKHYPVTGAFLIGFLLLGTLSSVSLLTFFDRVFSALVPNEKFPRIHFDTLPREASTLVVYPALVSRIGEIKALCEGMRRACFSSFVPQKGEEHLRFALLLDFSEGKEAVLPEDRVLASAAEEAVRELNRRYGNYFYLFLRPRRYCEEGVFRPWERKRGALLSLCALLLGRESELSCRVGEEEHLSEVQYVLTLDSDTVLTPRSVQELVGILAHPQNAPVTAEKDGVPYVARGYGILQPRIVPHPESAVGTPFSVLRHGAGGMSAYALAAFDRAQSLFSHGHFCGKGLFHVRTFESVLRDAFPENRILSHDLLEGARLSCAAVGDVVFFDDVPQTPASESAREHRWCRGDVQSLFFSGRRSVSASGVKRKNPMPLYYRSALWENLRRALVPVFSATLLVLSAFVPKGIGETFLFFALLPYLLPIALEGVSFLFSLPHGTLTRRFSAPLLWGLIQRVFNVLYDLSALFWDAYLHLDAILRALWRMTVSHEKTLEWKTAAQSSRAGGKGFLFYVKQRAFTVFFGVFLLFVSGNAAVRLIACLSLLHPVFCALLARTFKREGALSASSREQLSRFVRDASCFFRNEVSSDTHHLPPDHLTVSPVRIRAMRTSPTNIGMYLLSLCAMADFEILSVREVLSRIALCISSVERLPKWHGLLYNWYDLTTLSALDDYVSTVDEGNYLASLAALIGFLEECKDVGEDVSALESRVRALWEAPSLRVLYRPSLDLFAIGVHAESGKLDTSHYDQYMSEARLTSFLAIARGEVPLRHWRALSRELVLCGRHIGAASFSGTAFEYFMPRLFLPCVRGSFEEEMLATTALVQKRAARPSRYGPLYGVSESAFFASDSLSDYPYRAHGISVLALDASACGEEVISPYSSFLMLPVLGEDALRNLECQKRAGFYGEWGFYEAGQVANGEADVVKSYFAHHTGMAITAASNAVFSDVFCRRFMRNASLSAMLPLLCERIPAEGSVQKLSRARSALHRAQPLTEKLELKEGAQGALVLGAGESTLCYRLTGEVSVLWKQDTGLLLFRPEEGVRGGVHLFALLDGTLYSSLVRENPKDARLSLSLVAGGVCLKIVHGARCVLFSVRLSGRENALVLETEVTGGIQRGEVFLACAPLLKRARDYEAHPAFASLSLSAKKTARALFVTARERGGKECVLSLSDEAEREDSGPDVKVAPSLAAGRVEPSVFSEGWEEKFPSGVLLEGVLLCRRRLSLSPNATHAHHRFILGFSSSGMRAISAVPGPESFARAESVFCRARALSRLSSPLLPRALSLTEAVLSARRGRLVPENSEVFFREELYAFGISGDLPIVLVNVTEAKEGELYRFFASLYRYHALSAFSYDLVFFSLRDGYSRRGIDAAFAAVRHVGGEYLLGRRGGGIFLLEGDLSNLELLEDAACFRAHQPTVPLQTENRHRFSECEKRAPSAFFSVKGEAGEGSGRFVSQGFLIDRDVFDPAEHFSHLLGSETFGALVTHRSLGHTFETSSRFRRLTRPRDDAYGNDAAERLVLTDASARAFDLADCAAKVLFSEGCAVYYGTVGALQYRLTVFCHPTLLFRGVRAEFFGEGVFDLSYEFEPVLGDETGGLGSYFTKLSEDTLFVSRTISPLSRPLSLFLMLAGEAPRRTSQALGLSARVRVEGFCSRSFYLGAFESETQFSFLARTLRRVPFSALFDESLLSLRRRLPPPVSEGEGAREMFLNRFLPYQALASRLLCRTGFYQAGGAYGFRDQLQDALLYLSFAPEKLKVMLLRHASHQFPEGDVLHWWHNLPNKEGAHRGVRTRISDDYLWLVYAATRYVEKTGDVRLLSHPVPFLVGRTLGEKEHDLYDAFPFGKKVPFLSHLTAAADLFLSRGTGKHGLPFMLAGDWNDGFDAFGEGAESVFLAQFGGICLLRLAALLERVGQEESRAQAYRAAGKALFSAAEATFNGKWYARAYFGDGEALGADLSLTSPCSIDVLTQAFAAFSFLAGGGFERAHVFSALESVWEILFVKGAGVLRLFTPPFDARGRQVGYIRSYAAGVRENGGQYTHAAVWYAYACRAMAEESDTPALWKERAEKVMEALLPYRAALDREKARTWRLEPYALAGDVHSSESRLGRAGWTQYTGSAAWTWRYFAEKDEKNPF